MTGELFVEFPIINACKNILKYKTTGDLVDNFPKIEFLNYTFRDPSDDKLKAVDPKERRNCPIVAPQEIPGQFMEVYEDSYPVYDDKGNKVLMPFIQHAYIYVKGDNEDILELMK